MRKLALVLFVIAATHAAAQSAPLPGGEAPALQTTPERTAWKQTSTHDEVWSFLRNLAGLEHGERLRVSTFGRTLQGRALPLVKASLGAKDPLRALIIANIHGGEVEGKEVLQILLREIAEGGHQGILGRMDLYLVPVFNADGNDEINRGNRVNQNGPDGGVGKRTNSQDFDLNRDFVKVESPEVRALLGLLREHDPHLFMDLHTTNGSYHGYHLTYAPSLCTNLDPDLDAFAHDVFMPEVRGSVLEEAGVRVFDYGNFPRRQGQLGWYAFSADARLGWNYAGLRNRLSVLSEAYSYLSFEERAAATKAFVLGNLYACIKYEKRIRALCHAADERARSGRVRAFGHATERAPAQEREILVGEVSRVEIPDLGMRLVAGKDFEARKMPVSVRFVAKEKLELPAAWALVACSDDVRTALLIHGIEVWTLDEPADVTGEVFQVSSLTRGRAPFQGHRLVRIDGAYASQKRTLPAGTLLVPSRQRLASLAAQLLEAVSEDGLCTWNFFDSLLKKKEEAGEELGYPVVRLSAVPQTNKTRCVLDSAAVEVRCVLPLCPPGLEERTVLAIRCEKPGRRLASGAYESRIRWEGRVLHFEIEGEKLASLDDLGPALARLKPGTRTLIISADPLITQAELLEAADKARAAGMRRVYLEPVGR